MIIPSKDLTKSAYKLYIKYKSLVNLLYFYGYILKTKYKNLEIFSVSFSLLAIENFQNHLIFECLILKFSFWRFFANEMKADVEDAFSS
jgi:hypothetical protein